MISEKTKEGVRTGSLIRAMFTEGARMAEKLGKENVYDFTLGNPATPAPEKINRKIASLATEGDPLRLHGYMNNAGFPEVRAAVADNLNARFHTSYGQDNIVMTAGAAGGLNVVMKTILDPGDEVIVFAPYFVEYKSYIENYGGVIREARSDPETFFPDLSDLSEKLSGRTKAVIINTPNNPTGVVYPESFLKELGQVLLEAEKRFEHEIYLVSDEPYRELLYDDEEMVFVASCYRDTITAYSFSKSFSLPGERIGYLAVSDDCADHEQLLLGFSYSNRILGFVNAPSLIQKAVAECISEKTDVAFYDRNRKLLMDILSEMGFTFTQPKGAFYLWLKTPIDENEFVEKAKEQHILLVNGSAFGCPGYVRIAYCVSPEMIERSLPAFRRLAEACL